MNAFQSRISRLAPLSLAFGCLALPLLACDKSAPPAPVTTTAASAQAPASGAKKPAPIADADVAKAIQRHFQDERLLRSDHVQVNVGQGVASISGTVNSVMAKARALALTESIRGVRSVVDTIAVTPIARTDEQIKADIASALRADNATKSFAIGVVVKDGGVTLSGTADSFEQRRLFEDVVQAVPGVKALVDNITLHYATYRPAAEIVADAQHRIANDAWLDGNVVLVGLDGHIMHLSGIVGSAAQRTRARADAWVAGVDAIEDSGVIVDAVARDNQRHAQNVTLKSDADVTQAVRDAFRIDPRLRTLMPEVTVTGGVVTLAGTVDSAKARAAAESDARNTLGVWRVRDTVRVQPSSTPTDADIDRAAHRLLKEDFLLSDGETLHVSSVKGKVSLGGTIASGAERIYAIADLESIPGVTEIEDSLVVKRPPVEIKASIEDRLFWDPMVERDRVSVAIAPDGVATLTGTLDSWGEIKSAADDALWGGAVRVIDLLKLKDHPEVVAP